MTTNDDLIIIKTKSMANVELNFFFDVIISYDLTFNGILVAIVDFLPKICLYNIWFQLKFHLTKRPLMPLKSMERIMIVCQVVNKCA
uniref:Uncharacterized protein n=1 Tax=Glossina palpalis gambiensis TaxID=67801 RepID=A0A1B0B026_9MUSC